MRVLMLSWEYPPLVVGGIAAHVDGLARAMQRAGHEVVVCSLHHPDEPDDAVVDGVRVLRADPALPWLPDDDLVARMASANHQLVQLVAKLGPWRPEVVHAHDWLVAWAGDSLKTLLGVPLVATIHATERGRHGGHLPPGLPGTINSVEWWLTYQAREVIACSRFMAREVVHSFELPSSKVHLVPNGIDTHRWQLPPGAAEARREPLVVAWGRIQYEKGFQVLARAVSELRQRVPGIRCVIAGRGSYLPELQTQIDMEGVSDIVQLAGFVADEQLHEMLQRASCVVIPSLYEPFGIVALEGMAAGAPTIAARTGGLAEIIEGTDAGMLFEPGNHHELAECIADVLADPAAADLMRANAATLLRKTYTWDAVATETVQVYRTALSY
ncbi:MAG TPA: glycosyltransferase family 4 protein [Ilumatobacteraceae bacterium]|nr:glycosyltransferase family 4 protein [Ilumatobacteraceae bacterium]HRA83353.1 glycosyltransferase family 4 protein [Ilumatobacteraceae bacterium]HRC46932.1 glycosyltransferase family 4 protein [Ilumatobacteraceae bacterium]